MQVFCNGTLKNEWSRDISISFQFSFHVFCQNRISVIRSMYEEYLSNCCEIAPIVFLFFFLNLNNAAVICQCLL